MPLSFFFTRKRSASRANRPRGFRFESLERRMLLAANPIGEGEVSVDPVPDFHLVDVNPNSATYESEFSPRDLLDQTGALYFAHST
jgi:hypothetical protein